MPWSTVCFVAEMFCARRVGSSSVMPLSDGPILPLSTCDTGVMATE